MRRFLLLILLLPLPLASEVKILMPVVVKDAAGKPITDLKVSDFQVSGPKNASIERMWQVPSATVSTNDPRTPVVVLYDVANGRWARPSWKFLEQIAQDRSSVSILVNTTDGLRTIYDSATPPEVLSAALMLVKDPKATTNDPKIEQQAQRLRLLDNLDQNHTFRYDPGLNQMNSLIEVAHLLQSPDHRKPLLWFSMAEQFGSQRCELMAEQLNAAHVSVYPAAGPQAIFSDSSIVSNFVVLSESTGGLTFSSVHQFRNTTLFSSEWDALQKVLADFGPYYMLAIQAPTPKATDWIPVKITVDRPGLKIRGAPGFLGFKPDKKR